MARTTKRKKKFEIWALPSTGLAGKCCPTAQRWAEDERRPLRADADGQQLMVLTSTDTDTPIETQAWFCPFCGTKLVDTMRDMVEHQADLN